MGFFDGVKCFTGFHDWSSWSKPPHGKCRQTRHCTRSGCKAKESRVEHDWWPFKYVSQKSCKQKRYCETCKVTETRSGPHKWSVWRFLSDGACEQDRKCKKVFVNSCHRFWGLAGRQILCSIKRIMAICTIASLFSTSSS